MIYGLGIVAGTVLGFAGVASLSVGDHPPAPRVPTEAAGLIRSDRPRAAGDVLMQASGSTSARERTLVRAADRVFGDPVPSNVNPFASTSASELPEPTSSTVTLPIGKNVEVRLIARFGTDVVSIDGVLVACDPQWLQIRNPASGMSVLVSRSNVSYIRELAEVK